MTRTSEQRIGDITLVLAVAAALGFVANMWRSADIAGGSSKLFWSYLGLGVANALYPAFAAACVFTWMDDARTRMLANPLVALLLLCGLATVGAVILSRESSASSDEATYVLHASHFLMATAGISLVKGFFPAQLTGLARPDEDPSEGTE